MHGVAYDVKIKPVAFLNDAITLASQQVDAFREASGVDDATDQQIVAMNNRVQSQGFIQKPIMANISKCLKPQVLFNLKCYLAHARRQKTTRSWFLRRE